MGSLKTDHMNGPKQSEHRLKGFICAFHFMDSIKTREWFVLSNC